MKLLQLSTSFPPTGNTVPTVMIKIRILGSIFMTLRAVCFPLINLSNTIATHRIFNWSSQTHMFGINTIRDIANMVNGHTIWNKLNKVFKGPSMGKTSSCTGQLKDTITKFVSICSPKPTRIGFKNLLPKSFNFSSFIAIAHKGIMSMLTTIVGIAQTFSVNRITTNVACFHVIYYKGLR